MPKGRPINSDDPFIGRVYVQAMAGQNSVPGNESLHFESPENCYMLHDRGLAVTLPEMWLDDGTSTRPRRPFIDATYEEETRTFRGRIDHKMHGFTHMEIELVFAPNMSWTIGGYVKIVGPLGKEPRLLRLFKIIERPTRVGGVAPASSVAPGSESTKEPVDEEAAGEGKHHGEAICDRSSAPIVGIRYNLRSNRMYDLCQAEFDKLPEKEKDLFDAIPPFGSTSPLLQYVLHDEESMSYHAKQDHIKRQRLVENLENVQKNSPRYAIFGLCSEAVFLSFTIYATFVGFSKSLSDISAWYINWITFFMATSAITSLLSGVGLYFVLRTAADNSPGMPTWARVALFAPALLLCITSVHSLFLAWSVPRAWALSEEKCWALMMTEDRCELMDTCFDLGLIIIIIQFVVGPLMIIQEARANSMSAAGGELERSADAERRANANTWVMSFASAVNCPPPLLQPVTSLLNAASKVFWAYAVYSTLTCVASISSMSPVINERRLNAAPPGYVLVCMGGEHMGMIDSCVRAVCNPSSMCQFMKTLDSDKSGESMGSVMSAMTGAMGMITATISLTTQYMQHRGYELKPPAGPSRPYQQLDDGDA